MDRDGSSCTERNATVRASRAGQKQFVLRARWREYRKSGPDAFAGCSASADAVLRGSSVRSLVQLYRPHGQSETCAAIDAADESAGHLPAAADDGSFQRASCLAASRSHILYRQHVLCEHGLMAGEQQGTELLDTSRCHAFFSVTSLPSECCGSTSLTLPL